MTRRRVPIRAVALIGRLSGWVHARTCRDQDCQLCWTVACRDPWTVTYPAHLALIVDTVNVTAWPAGQSGAGPVKSVLYEEI